MVQRNAEPLPSWIYYNEVELTMTFKPAQDDLYKKCLNQSNEVKPVMIWDHSTQNTRLNKCVLELILQSTDSYEIMPHLFYVVIYNHLPFLYRPIYTINDLESVLDAHPYEKFELQLSVDSFYDLDKLDLQKLEYVPYQEGMADLPLYMYFNQDMMRFYGTPSKYDIGTWKIYVNCTDGIDVVQSYFIINVFNNAPFPVVLTNESYYVGLDEKFSIYMSYYTFYFRDPDQDKLVYTAELLNRSL